MNMQAIMAQAQKMQRDIQKKKEEINQMSFVGESELVNITMNGKKEITKVEIKGEIDSSDKEMLEDMILLATNKAIKTPATTMISSFELSKAVYMPPHIRPGHNSINDINCTFLLTGLEATATPVKMQPPITSIL